MDYKNIKFSIENGIAHLVLARDDIRNAFSEKTFTDEIVDAVERTQLSEDARVLLLSAEGSAFSAGGNVKDMKDKKGIFGGGAAGTDEATSREFSKSRKHCIRWIYRLFLPFRALPLVQAAISRSIAISLSLRAKPSSVRPLSMSVSYRAMAVPGSCRDVSVCSGRQN